MASSVFTEAGPSTPCSASYRSRVFLGGAICRYGASLFGGTIDYEFDDDAMLVRIHGALAPDVCAGIIKHFEESPHKEQGTTVSGIADVKRSTDICISHPAFLKMFPAWEPVYKFLHDRLRELLPAIQEHWPSLTAYMLGREHGYRIQRSTAPTDGYDWHVDQMPLALTGADKPDEWGLMHDMSPRMLACIWYLNDDFEGGTTQFDYQKREIVPETGMLALFPPFWTHRHRGAIVTKGTKYIITTQIIEGYHTITL